MIAMKILFLSLCLAFSHACLPSYDVIKDAESSKLKDVEVSNPGSVIENEEEIIKVETNEGDGEGDDEDEVPEDDEMTNTDENFEGNLQTDSTDDLDVVALREESSYKDASVGNITSNESVDLIDDETTEDIAVLMEVNFLVDSFIYFTFTISQEVEKILSKLTEDQMTKLQDLLELHYAKQHEERDKMLGELVTGDENIKELVNLVVVLEEKGATINLLNDED